MNSMIKEVKENMNMGYIKVSRRVKEALNNERGEILTYVLFVAIIVLAVIAVSPTVKTIFTDTASAVKTWIEDKVSEVLK